jgi:hypothetical protein
MKEMPMTTATRDPWSAGYTGALCRLSIKHTETVSERKETQPHLNIGHILKDYEMVNNLYVSKQFASP